MPLIELLRPSLLTTLRGPSPPHRPFLIFYADRDERTGKMWCGDCVVVEDTLKEKFSAPDGPTGLITYVGDKPTWRSPNNEFRKEYNLTAIPTIIRLENGVEVGRLVEGELLDNERLDAFIEGKA